MRVCARALLFNSAFASSGVVRIQVLIETSVEGGGVSRCVNIFEMCACASSCAFISFMQISMGRARGEVDHRMSSQYIPP